MSDDQITNGRRAALALDAISTYTRMSPSEGLPEDYFFLDSEREPGQELTTTAWPACCAG